MCEDKEKIQEAWENAFPDSAALEREVKRRWGLSYFDFMNLMQGRIEEATHIKVFRITILFFQLTTLLCQLWLSVRLLRLAGLL